jgi:hypothetical protein
MQAPASLGDHHDGRHGGDQTERMLPRQVGDAREDRKLARDPPGHREAVVGLPNALRDEVNRRRRPPYDEQIVREIHTAAGSADGPEELEILEQHVAVISSRRLES